MALDKSRLPTAKVTAATAAAACVEFAAAMVEWLAGDPVPAGVTLPAIVIATFLAGYYAPKPKDGGEHAADRGGDHVAR